MSSEKNFVGFLNDLAEGKNETTLAGFLDARIQKKERLTDELNQKLLKGDTKGIDRLREEIAELD